MEYKIPTWSPSQDWHYTFFSSREEFREYLKTLFKEPGLYAFDEVSFKFNEHAKNFVKKGIYCEYQEETKGYINYWDKEKEKCRKGVLFKNDKGGEWYLSRSFYHWINFLQIYDKRKDKKVNKFPDFRDVQYHITLYHALAELHDMNSVILKRRQVASSYVHIARIFNKYIFEEGFTAKIGASDKGYIEGEKGCWKYLNHYKNFNNEHTAWIRYNDPDAIYKWQQKTKKTVEHLDGTKSERVVGTLATIVGVTFDQDPIKGVGGAVDEFYYEEGGDAPTADLSYGYLIEAMKEGAEVTGFFAIAGSVGDLKRCKPIKSFMDNPTGHGFYPVTSNLLNDTGKIGETGLFIPVFWGYHPYIDEYGNSMVEEAKKAVNALYEEQRVKLAKTPHLYQLLVSQGPRNIAEAFAIRTESIFPIRYTSAQLRRIEDNMYWFTNCELERGDDGKIVEKRTDRLPNEYPASRTKEDKRGCCIVHERPIPDAPWLTYFASVDPIEVGKTKTSDSLACVYVWKNAVEVIKEKADGTSEVFLEGGKLVCELTCRYDDPNETNEMLSRVVEWYNAWTISENNKTSFINYMRIKKRQRYLARKTDMLFDKEMKVVQNEFQEYGWTNTPAMWSKIIEYGIDFLSEETNPDATEYSAKQFGYERLPFINLIREMQSYTEDDNFDRIISYCSLMAFVKIQQAIRGTQRRVVRREADLDNQKTIADIMKGRSAFNNIGKPLPAQTIKKRSAFHNMR